MIKIIIVVLVLGLLASLVSGFYYLMVDQGDKNSRRTLNSLGVRLTLAITLLGVIIFGVATGRLGNRTPWDAGPKGAATAQPTPADEADTEND